MLFEFRIDICIRIKIMRYLIYYDIHNVSMSDSKGYIQESNAVKITLM